MSHPFSPFLQQTPEHATIKLEQRVCLFPPSLHLVITVQIRGEGRNRALVQQHTDEVQDPATRLIIRSLKGVNQWLDRRFTELQEMLNGARFQRMDQFALSILEAQGLY